MLPQWPLMPWPLALTPQSIRGKRFMPPPTSFFPSQSKSIFARVTKAMCLTPSPNEQPLMRNGFPQRDCALRKASLLLSSCQVVLTLCNPVECSTPGFPVPHYLLEFAQTHVHWIGDAIQPSHPLSPTSPPALNLPQHLPSFYSNPGDLLSQELGSFPCQSSWHNIFMIFLFRWFKVVSTLPKALDLKPLLRRYH